MTRRTLRVAGLVAGFLLALYLIPLLPPVRGWLLGAAQSLAADAGYQVSFEGSAGNLWHGLRLSGVRVVGPGLDADLDTLALSYTLPALVTGTLPLSLETAGVRGDVVADELAAAFTPDAPPAPGAEPRGGFRIQPLLRHAEVSDVALSLGGIPLNLADVQLTDVRVQGQGERLDFSGALAAEGATAEVQGQVTPAPFNLSADVRADVALARPFFEGLEGGVLTGTVRADDAGVSGDLELRGGEASLVGLELREVGGPVALRGERINAELTGRTLGGPVAGTATVDLGAQEWTAEITGTPALSEAASWLAEGRVPLEPERLQTLLGVAGHADARLSLSGWQVVTLEGSARGAGELLGEPLTALQVDFGFLPGAGVHTQARAQLGDAPLSFALSPTQAGGFTVQAEGVGVPLAEGVRGDFDLDLAGLGDGLSGSAEVLLQGELSGRPGELELQALGDGDVWRFELSGGDDRGAQASGEVALQNGEVVGEVALQALELPGLGAPVDAGLSADGPLGALPLRLELTAPEGPTFAGITAADDLSGNASATLEGTRLEGLTGRFGPLSLSGALDLATRSGVASYTLAPTSLEGRAAGEVAVEEGALQLNGGQVQTSGTLQSKGVQAAGVTLPDLSAAFELAQGVTPGDTLSARLQDSAQGLGLTLESGVLRGSFRGTELGALGETFSLGGTVSRAVTGPADGTPTPGETLELDLTAAAPGTRLSAVGDAARVALSLRSEAGASLAGRTLARPLELSGEASPQARSAQLAGSLGELGVALDTRPDASGSLQAEATLSSGDESLRASLAGRAGGGWETEGELPLASLGDALGLPLTGTLRSDLASQGGVFSGDASFEGEVFGLPLSGRAQGTGETGEALFSANSLLLGEPLSLTGRTLPGTDASLEAPIEAQVQLGDLGALELRGPLGALSVFGQGQVPRLERAGLSVPAQPWRMQGDLGAGELELQVGASALSARRSAEGVAGEGGWTLQGEVQQGAQLAGLPLSLNADVSGEGSSYRGSGTLGIAGQTVPVQLSGTGGAVQGGAQFDGFDLAALTPVSGTVTGEARFNTAEGPRYGVDLSADGSAFGAPFELTLLADPGSLQASGEVAGAAVKLTGAASSNAPLNILEFTLEDQRLPLELNATLDLREGAELTGSGFYQREALELAGSFPLGANELQADETSQANLRATLGDADFTAALQPEMGSGGARRLTGALRAPTGLLNLSQPLSVDLQLVQEADGEAESTVRLEGLRAEVGENVLELRGTVGLGGGLGGGEPQADLSGSLELPAAGPPFALRLTSLETGYLAALTQEALELRAVLSPRLVPQRVRLEGEAARLGGTLESDLVWQDGAGFAGAATLTSNLPINFFSDVAEVETAQGQPQSLQTLLTLTGDETLAVDGEASYGGAAVASLGASLTADPWRDRRLRDSLRGSLELNAPLHELLPGWVGAPLTLAGQLTLQGALDSPQLGGPVQLTGALAAAGTLQADRQSAQVELLGEGLSAVASLSREGYAATVSADALELSGVLPQPGGAPVLTPASTTHLSGALRVTQNLGSLQAQLSDLRLRRGDSLLSGRARFDGALDGALSSALELDAQLSDLNPALQGRLSGPLRVGADSEGSLEASLELTEAGLVGETWTLEGALNAGGSFSDPTLAVRLEGAGSASGSLRAEAAPQQGTLEVASDLRVAGLETDLRVARTLPTEQTEQFASQSETAAAETAAALTPQLQAQGRLRYGDLGIALTDDAGLLVLTGSQRLTGWRAQLEPTTTLFTLQGPLDSLNSQLRGHTLLNGDLRALQADGTLAGLQVAGLELGDLGVAVTGTQAHLSGELLDASATLSGALPWQLERLELPLPGGLAFTATGSGTRHDGSLGGLLRRAEDAPPTAGATPDGSLSLPLRASYSPAGFGVSAQGELPFGTLDAEADFDGEAWRGGVTLDGPLRVQSTLEGPLTQPRLGGSATTPGPESAEDSDSATPFALQSTFSLSPDAASFEADLDAPTLSTPLSLRGSGWPLELSAQTQPSVLPTQSVSPTQAAEGLRLELAAGVLRSEGVLTFGVGPAELQFTGGEALELLVSVPAAPGLALSSSLPQDLGMWPALLQEVTFSGAERTEGTLTLRPSPLAAKADALRWTGDAGVLSLNGGVETESGLTGSFAGSWSGAEGAALPWLELELPLALEVQGDILSLTSNGSAGSLFAQAAVGAQRLELDTDLELGGGRVQLTGVRYAPDTGPQGEVVVDALPVARVGDEAVRLGGRLELSPSGFDGQGELSFGNGRLDVTGELGWTRALPEALTARFLPAADDALSAQLRLERFDLGGVPWVAQRLPYLEAPASGVAQLSPDQVVGQLLAPELRVQETALPSQAEFNGTLQQLEVRASIGDSRLNLQYRSAPKNTATDTVGEAAEDAAETGGTLSGLLTLEQFPLHALAEAAVGEAQVIASATGAARFEVPLAAPRESYVQLASERLTLRRADRAEAGLLGASTGAGRVTEGEVALRYENGSLNVERAEFRGDGFWRAEGQLTPRDLDFTLEAQDADFTPLLSLVPQLAAFQVGASGSLDLRASGSLSAPDITLVSPALELSVAGSSYRALGTEASLSGGAFGLSSDLALIAPLRGRLDLRGNGQISLSPFVTSGLALRFGGDVTIPTVGEVTGVSGRIFPGSSGVPSDLQLEASGALGNPLTVTGALSPLDLTLQGQGLDLRADRFFLAGSDTDLELNLTSGDGEFLISGGAFAREAQLSLARRTDAVAQTGSPVGAETDAETDPETGPETDEGASLEDALSAAGITNGGGNGLAGGLENGAGLEAQLNEDEFSGDNGDLGSSAAAGLEAPLVAAPDAQEPTSADSEVDRTPNPVLQRVRFDNVTVRAPREVIFQEGFGNAELGFDLTLSGTAAAPLVAGEARTLRGSIRFSGQEFVLTQAVASFDPAQGALPTLALEAQASFEKARALGVQANSAELIAPPGPSFEVQLSVTGGFEEAARGRRSLELEPTLTSNALIQETGEGTSRPLSEPELVSLLTLGRLQLGAPLTGVGGVAGSVAESALDTAVDLLVLSELQNAVGEAIGVDLFEIRTSSLSTILDGQLSDPFGVSVRFGGYLSDDLFASVQVGRFDDPDQTYALSNEFSLRYTLDPLQLNLSGGVNLQGRTTLTTVTDFNLSLGYNISPLISLDAALETSTQGRDTRIGFGVNFTW